MMYSSQHTQRLNRQQGAVSLFVVLFSAFLMVIVTVSFTQLMLKDQQQATASDLSQSAYDSAQAGVEDAKRVLLMQQACKNKTSTLSGTRCDEINAAIASGECNTITNALKQADDETIVQQKNGDGAKDLQQAYTCVAITSYTDDYKGKLDNSLSSLIPLRGAASNGASASFDAVKISWFMRDDIASTTNNPAIAFPAVGGSSALLPRPGTQWAANTPALLRAQFMQTGSSFSLNDFNDAQPVDRSNANTLFLYPSSSGATNLSFHGDDGRRSQSNQPRKVRCASTFAGSVLYACSVTIAVPAPITGSASNRNAFLRLSALYNAASYKIELLQGSAPVLFDGVQPKVDSTGRANDMFRRVEARVELTSNFLYPEAAVDIEGSLCKDFSVTDDPNEYGPNTCTP